MRFYDPLINIVRVGMDDVRKGFFFFKYEVINKKETKEINMMKSVNT